MTIDAAWPFFVMMAVVMGLAASPLFRFLDEVHDPQTRSSTIDGLRGFLALGVFGCHLIVNHRFIETGVWSAPDSRFYFLLGSVGVSLFFMLTAFLFWGKLLRAQGRPRWAALYTGRLFRIGPLYLAVVIVMLAVVFARTDAELREPVGAVASSVLQWLALGWIDTLPDVNGYDASSLVAGVTWTLWYEWVFYAALLALAAFARPRVHLPFVLTALLLCLVIKAQWRIGAAGFAALFVIGMLVASLLHENRLPRLPQNVSSALALLIMGGILVGSSSGYGTLTALWLAAFAYLVCSGTSMFGLLNTTAAQRLGRISYSLYLVHGLVIALVFGIDPVRRFAMASPLPYWVAGAACACVLLLAAALSYVFIERPGIALGASLIARGKLFGARRATQRLSNPGSGRDRPTPAQQQRRGQ